MKRTTMHPNDGFTAAMHAELSVTPGQDRRHIAVTALEAIEDGDFTEAEARELYQVTLEELAAA